MKVKTGQYTFRYGNGKNKSKIKKKKKNILQKFLDFFSTIEFKRTTFFDLVE